MFTNCLLDIPNFRIPKVAKNNGFVEEGIKCFVFRNLKKQALTLIFIYNQYAQKICIYEITGHK